MRTGRKRNPNVLRDASGKSRGEKAVVHPETVAVRERELLKMGLPLKGSQALDQLAGFTLGCLLLRGRANKDDPGGISQDQYDAGDAWQKLCRRHAAIMGYKLSVKSPSFLMVAGGLNTAPEPDETEIERVKAKWSACYDKIMEVCREEKLRGRDILRARDVVYGVCVENWPLSHLRAGDFGLLRLTLNALGKVL